MRGGSKCASTTAGGQCVITTGVTQKLQWSVSSWGIQLLDVSYVPLLYVCIRAHGWISHYKAALHSTCLAWFMYAVADLGGIQGCERTPLWTLVNYYS